jgi:hypothetical protein
MNIYKSLACDVRLFLLAMKEVKTGGLMLLVCAALYVQIDPRIWDGLCQLLSQCMVGWS